MRANYNRQARRAGHCFGMRRPRSPRRVSYPRRAWLTAYGIDLARVAERIELELPADLVHLLSPAWLPTAASVHAGREASTERKTPDVAMHA